jgi:predicted DNA-binding transcriptional regulator AlpA
VERKVRRFLRFKEMQERGIFNDRVAARRAVQNGFLAPYELAPNTLAWAEDEVDEYLANRPQRLPGSKAFPRAKALEAG